MKNLLAIVPALLLAATSALAAPSERAVKCAQAIESHGGGSAQMLLAQKVAEIGHGSERVVQFSSGAAGEAGHRRLGGCVFDGWTITQVSVENRVVFPR